MLVLIALFGGMSLGSFFALWLDWVTEKPAWSWILVGSFLTLTTLFFYIHEYYDVEFKKKYRSSSRH